ncbi:hypothetical protein Droror1_Dr00027756 [Drosera rotundifolia]
MARRAGDGDGEFLGGSSGGDVESTTDHQYSWRVAAILALSLAAPAALGGQSQSLTSREDTPPCSHGGDVEIEVEFGGVEQRRGVMRREEFWR